MEGGLIMGKLILLFGVLTGVFFVLYQCGILVYQSKTAVSFVGSPKGNGATFRSCSGFLRRVVRFRADGTYTYVLNAQLSKGQMSVELLDSKKQSLMRLDPANPRAGVSVEKSKKYHLIFRFASATGSYTLIREECEEQEI